MTTLLSRAVAHLLLFTAGAWALLFLYSFVDLIGKTYRDAEHIRVPSVRLPITLPPNAYSVLSLPSASKSSISLLT